MATKCGLWAVGQTDVYDLRPSSIRREVDESRRRLGVEVIDLYQIHWPDQRTGTPLEESWTTMAELVTEGKVRHLGVSNSASSCWSAASGSATSTACSRR